MVDLSLRSPLRRLVVFFRDSRDKWKKKCPDRVGVLQSAAGERLPGSSEVLESIIGKYKRLQGESGQPTLSAAN